MERKELELFRQQIFDNQSKVIDLEKQAKKLREECILVIQKLRKECPHTEVAHQGGWISKVLKYAEVDMNCDSSYLELEVRAPERECLFCGQYELGRHVLGIEAFKDEYNYLEMDEIVNLDIEYIFEKLGNQENRKVFDRKELVSKLLYPKEYF